MATRDLDNFSAGDLAVLLAAAKILASKRAAINLRLQVLHPECHTAWVLRRRRVIIDKALANLPDWSASPFTEGDLL